jgi:predicted nucleotidyltransferase
MIYRERFSFARQLREFLPEFYSPKASFFHYLHMARGNLREYLKGENVWRKKYFYVLRPLLAMKWIEEGFGPVPIEFQKLVDATLPTGTVRCAVDDLLAAKRSGAELDRGPRIPAISDFIESEVARLEQVNIERAAAAPSPERLNELFRTTLKEVAGTP